MESLYQCCCNKARYNSLNNSKQGNMSMTALQNSSSELKSTRICDESERFPWEMEENVSFQVAEYIRNDLQTAFCRFICPSALISSAFFDYVNILSHAQIPQTSYWKVLLFCRALGLKPSRHLLVSVSHLHANMSLWVIVGGCSLGRKGPAQLNAQYWFSSDQGSLALSEAAQGQRRPLRLDVLCQR